MPSPWRVSIRVRAAVRSAKIAWVRNSFSRGMLNGIRYAGGFAGSSGISCWGRAQYPAWMFAVGAVSGSGQGLAEVLNMNFGLFSDGQKRTLGVLNNPAL